MLFEKRSMPIRASNNIGFSIVNGQLVVSDNYLSAETAIKNSDIWTAVNVIASDIARVKLSSENKDVDRLLKNPSNLSNRYGFMQSMIAQMLLAGNSYALRRVQKGKEYWEFVKPSDVTINLADDGRSIAYDLRFQPSDEKDELNVKASDVIHFKMLSLDGGLSGRSPLESLASELDLQASSTNLAKSMFRRAINPSGILKSKSAKLDKNAKNVVRDEFEKQNTGDNAGRVLVMDGLFDYTQLEIKSDVANLLNSTDWTREQIAKAFMLPKDMLGGESAHSNVEQIRALYNTTLGRYLAPIVEELALKLDVDISSDVRSSTDLDGSNLEQRVIALVQAGVLTAPQGYDILANSNSDVVTNVTKQEVLNEARKTI